MTRQQSEALQLANQIRIAGSLVRAEIAAGLLTVEDALADPRAQVMPIGRLLCALPHWGPKKSSYLLNGAFIWPTRRVRDLTDRQKAVIVEALTR